MGELQGGDVAVASCYSAIVWPGTDPFNRETFSEIGNTGFKRSL
jgi:hypothetical protein